jgi:S-formylglutathione hydrolase
LQYLFIDFKDEYLWKQYDACELVSSYHGPLPYAPVLIDQGSDDKYKDNYLFPHKLIDACANASFPIQLREQVGYEHGYYLIMTFLEDHFEYHKKEFEHSN